MFFLYQLFLLLIVIFSPLIIIYRILKKKEDKKRFVEKFSIFSRKRNKGKLIWFHGASVGELLSILPLIKNYEKNKKIDQILVTSSTLSSSKVLKKFTLSKTIHQFYPIDNFFFINKFLNYWKPSAAIFVDSEIWPCMFKNINKKQIPLILLNARLSKKTFSNWFKFKNFSKSVFKNITFAFPQNIETKNYLKKLKTNKIIDLGNLKFAENFGENIDRINNKLKTELKKKKVWVASSTHKSEEIFCARAHIELKKKVSNLITIVIPRHVDRSNEIKTEIEELNLKVVNHSSKINNLKDVDIYIVDTFGETKKFHKIGYSVFLGGSIINRGGQNPLEAARYGAKILHGPNVNNFKDVYKFLKSINISKKILTPKELASSIIFKKNKSVGNKIKNIGKNILKKTIKKLDKIIINELKKT
tara:strand:+ start:1165 stop:2415 length:1251 start_codon:yes stop_codon:yes gene_type:complete